MLRMLIEVAAGSRERLRYNEQTLELLGTRPGGQAYPYPYGFIIGASAADGGCVDCYLITRQALAAGAVAVVEPVGLLLQDEDGESDHKILAVLEGEQVEIGPGLLAELQAFIYANFAQHPELKIRVGPILPPEAALEYLRAAGAP